MEVVKEKLRKNAKRLEAVHIELQSALDEFHLLWEELQTLQKQNKEK